MWGRGGGGVGNPSQVWPCMSRANILFPASLHLQLVVTSAAVTTSLPALACGAAQMPRKWTLPLMMRKPCNHLFWGDFPHNAP